MPRILTSQLVPAYTGTLPLPFGCGLEAAGIVSAIGSIALEQVGEMKSIEAVFVSAAAGGTGQYVVQLAKLAGNHVIGTCSSDEKVEDLKKIGCDRAINYMKEDVDAVLKKEYPNGVDLVFETVRVTSSVRGFFLQNHAKLIPLHIERLLKLMAEGKLNPGIDPTEFRGLESIPDVVDYMYARKNSGKLIVQLN
ncbi:unnamed protein product [Peronospora belbahrii]|uniref:Enoyl reductase (ER) domain-containing protein n=1 Tax=Peronospora belbahrii TaxID=622444 RepID=A0AAU9L9H8_9STRA|nr:unnamed protein product [Peronospora belbahrii]CAH0521700.1 unnamed protein product [Peronospora belbahrii]